MVYGIRVLSIKNGQIAISERSDYKDRESAEYALKDLTSDRSEWDGSALYLFELLHGNELCGAWEYTKRTKTPLLASQDPKDETFESSVRRYGNSLAVVIPQKTVRYLGLEQSDVLLVNISKVE